MEGGQKKNKKSGWSCTLNRMLYSPTKEEINSRRTG